MLPQAAPLRITVTLCALCALEACIVVERTQPAPGVVEQRSGPTDTVEGTIVPGASTQEDVADLLGPPSSAHREADGTIVWTYWSTETASGGYAHQAIRVVFDSGGVVVRVKTSRAAP